MSDSQLSEDTASETPMSEAPHVTAHPPPTSPRHQGEASKLPSVDGGIEGGERLPHPSPSDLQPAASPEPEQSSRRGGLWIVGGIAIVGLLLLAVFYWGVLNPPGVRHGEGEALPIEFTSYDGQEIKLSDYKGMPVVVNFWASWCYPCRDEQADLEAAWRKYKGDVMFLGVAHLDQEPNALAYLDEFDVTYPSGPDMGGRIYNAYHVGGVPETFFIDANGQVQGFHVGPIPARELDRRIQELLQME